MGGGEAKVVGRIVEIVSVSIGLIGGVCRCGVCFVEKFADIWAIFEWGDLIFYSGR